MSDPLLDQLPNVWRADSLIGAHRSYVSTGDASLDEALGGGWPSPALIELLSDKHGIGELQLLMPLIAHCQRQSSPSDRQVVLWLNPPFDIQAVALLQYGLDPSQHWIARELSERDTMWAMEQALRSRACGLVLGWVQRIGTASLRRLKLAALSSGSFGVLFRPTRERSKPSPATIRAVLNAHADYLHVELIKVQGRACRSVMVEVNERVARAEDGAPL